MREGNDWKTHCCGFFFEIFTTELEFSDLLAPEWEFSAWVLQIRGVWCPYTNQNSRRIRETDGIEVSRMLEWEESGCGFFFEIFTTELEFSDLLAPEWEFSAWVLQIRGVWCPYTDKNSGGMKKWSASILWYVVLLWDFEGDWGGTSEGSESLTRRGWLRQRGRLKGEYEEAKGR